jgi:hypothetical protein
VSIQANENHYATSFGGIGSHLLPWRVNLVGDLVSFPSRLFPANNGAISIDFAVPLLPRLMLTVGVLMVLVSLAWGIAAHSIGTVAEGNRCVCL